MNNFEVKNIEPNSFFSKNVYLDGAFVISTPEIPFSENIAALLKKWSFTHVKSEGEPHKNYSLETSDADGSGSSEKGVVSFSKQPDAENLEKAAKFYLNFISYVEAMFNRLAISEELDYKEVINKIKDMVEYIRDERRFLMRVLKSIEADPDKSYLAIHSVRTTILSIVIGTHLKLPNHRLMELGAAALLHEAGMLKLPSRIYMSNKALAPAEQKAILTHPVLGYSLLKSLDFPLAVCLAALEHHERENGTGYPQRLSSEKISLYSKIIAVTCSYEALSSKRPHREAKDGYTGMLELLKNEGKQYDDSIVKALTLSLSIYPIGTHVLLSNGMKGQVVDVNMLTPRFPIVQIFGDVAPDGKIKVMQTTSKGLHIVRPLRRSEIQN